MGHVILRVDGSGRIGMGHIMRCIAFAQGFEKVGVKGIFVGRSYKQNIVKFIRHSNFCVESISKDCSFSEDAALTLDLAEKHGADVVVTDISNPDVLADINAYQRYLRLLRNGGKFLVTIDGFNGDCISNKLKIPSDMVIVPYYGAKGKKYKRNKGTNFLLGPSFFLFRQEYIKAAKVKKQIKRKAGRILVSMGGSDPHHLTPKVVKALTKLDRQDLYVKVVVGPGFSVSLRRKIEIASQHAAGVYELVAGSDNMAKLMLWADLAIITSGLTVYETAVTGTPSIVLAQYDYHKKIMDRFSRERSFLHLGYGEDVGEAILAETIDGLLRDFNVRKEMSRRGKRIVDGKGVERIISDIPKELLV